VRRADVSLRAKEAVVVFDAGDVTVEQMVAAVKQLGFQASVKGTR
jgi:copper chaperone CopZ